MAADKSFTLHPGRLGLNFRDDPAALSADELASSLNWRITARGSLVKRLGVGPFSAVDAPAQILRLGVYAPFNAGPFVVAYCVDGSVQQTDDGQSWTVITTGLSSAMPSFAQYQDRLYISNGVDGLVEWDGSIVTVHPTADVADVQTITITGTPTGGTFKLTLTTPDGITNQTGTIVFNASAAVVQTALEALTNVESGDVVCTGGSLPGTGVVVTFAGNLAHQPIGLMTTADSFTGGTAPVSTVTHTVTGETASPLGEFLCVWRNRLWVANSQTRTVNWSASGDPADWRNHLNFVTFPNAPLTGIATGGQRTQGTVSFSTDGGDGVLVFCQDQTYRIYDDSDNGGDIVSGGSNIVLDPGRGAVASRSIATGNGRVYCVCADGVYSTDGHDPLVLESKMITPLFAGGVISTSDLAETDGCFHEGCYYLAYSGVSATGHNRLLELYLNLPSNGERQHPWMAHDVSATSLVSLPNDLFLIADARDGLEASVRSCFSGFADVTGSDPVDIFAVARTGMVGFDLAGPKRIKRVDAYGHGRCTITAISNDGTQESKSFSMPITIDTWNPAESWGGTWGDGGASPVRSDLAYYTRSGHFIAFEIAERSQNPGPPAQVLGDFAAGDEGGMKITALQAVITPLDSWL